ncbi:MAG: hypothetical protein WC256_14040 [Desulfurivibrionaceae bacterium]|jgi:hypothetical protein
MALSKNKVPIQATIDSKVNALLQEYADKLGVKKAKFAKDLIYSALRSLKIFKSVGLISIGKDIRDVIEFTVKKFGINKEIFVHIDDDPVTITITVDEEVKNIMKEYADFLEISDKIFARNCIYIGLDDFKVFNMLGITKLARYSNAFRKFVAGYHEE